MWLAFKQMELVKRSETGIDARTWTGLAKTHIRLSVRESVWSCRTWEKVEAGSQVCFARLHAIQKHLIVGRNLLFKKNE